jgi:hypothetical protein
MVAWLSANLESALSKPADKGIAIKAHYLSTPEAR